MQIMTPPSHILGLLNIVTALDTGAWIRLHPPVRHRLDAAPHREPTASRSRWRSHRSRWRSPPIRIWSPTTCRRCATSCGARRRSRRASPRPSPRRTGVSWVTAYGTSELPVIACNAARRRAARHRRPAGARRRPAGGVAGDRRGLGAGEVGEIQVRSDSLMAGYLPDDGDCGRVLRRVVPHRRCRLTRRRRAGCGSPTGRRR